MKAHDSHQLKSSIEQAIQKIYEIRGPDEYLNGDGKKILIVDDLRSVEANAPQFEAIMGRISSRFDCVVLLSSSPLNIQNIIQNDEVLPRLASISRYSILAMSNVSRSVLVDNWSRVGASPLSTADELQAERIELEHQIDELLGRGLVPATPFYVLSLLGAIGQGLTPRAGLGSLGYLYDLLIRTSLAKSVKQPDLMQVMDTFLSELAYGMFVKQEVAIFREEFDNRCEQFSEHFYIQLDPDQALRMLSDAYVLIERSGQVGFRYKYVLCFYVARYLGQQLSTREHQEAVERLLEDIHHQDSGDILAFLCHCTADPFVAKSLKDRIDSLFDGEDEVDLEEGLRFFNSIGSESPRPDFSLPASDPEGNRQELLRERDESSGSESHEDDLARMEFLDHSKDESGKSSTLSRDIASAFRVMEITGQTLRNHPTQIVGSTKLDILRSINRLAGRMMGSMLRAMEGGADKYVPAIEKAIRKQKIAAADDKVRILSQMIYRFEVESAALGIVCGYAATMGGDTILTLSERLRTGKSDSLNDILELAVRLESPRKFPEADAFKLREAFEDNEFVKNCLKALVYFNLYIFKRTDFKQKQRICNKFEINFTDPSLLREGRRKV